MYVLIILLFLFLLTETRAQERPYGLTQRVPITDLRVASSGYELADMRLRRAFPNLSFVEPLYLTHAADGSDRLFVVERLGAIRVFSNRDDIASSALFLDLQDRVSSFRAELGLLGLAFHPRYSSNGKFYVYYMGRDLTSRLSEFRVSDDPDATDASSERVILEFRQPSASHNGGQIAFGPDGFLYIGLGDGGDPNDLFENGQDPTTILGAILRIDVDRTEDDRAYAIPTDNPFVGNDRGWREEIWAWGLRNPWRFSFDRHTGQLWAGDVGQDRWEEVDLIEKGGNYGWNILEGFACLEGNDCNGDAFVPPILAYGHDQGRAITGGYVYRGDRLIRLRGTYLYGDFGSRLIWGLHYENGQVLANRVIASSPEAISSFGEDEAGEIYAVGFSGGIYTFEEKSAAELIDRVPERISASGVFADPATQEPAPGFISYSVNSALWSDGAAKTRLLALPGKEQIAFSRDGSWQFPPGALLVKNFYLNMEEDNATSRRIVETRFLVKRNSGPEWDGFSYMWNEDGTDAVLLEDAHDKTFAIADPAAPDGVRQHRHYFPSRADCNICHTPAAGFALGVHTAQLNRDHDYGAIVDHQLRAFNHIGLFTADIGEDYADFPRLSDPLDERLPLAPRARSYLDANCSHCHRPGGTGLSDMDLRSTTPLDATRIVGMPPTFGNLGVPDAHRLQRGAPERSMLYLRMLDLDRRRMPPLATFRIDAKGIDLIYRWIDKDPTSVTTPPNTQAHTFALHQNYPNPFNSSTSISYKLSETAPTQLSIFSLNGQLIKQLVDAPQPAGTYQIAWDGTTTHRRKVASGMYLVRLQNGAHMQSRKLLLLK